MPPPPLPASLSVIVLFTMVNVASLVLLMPPPNVAALLPLTVELDIVKVPAFLMPPPQKAEVLPVMKLPMMVACPMLMNPPPLFVAMLL